MNEQAWIARLERIETAVEDLHTELERVKLANQALLSEKRALLTTVDQLKIALGTSGTYGERSWSQH